MRWKDDKESSDEEGDSTVDSEDEISLNKTKQKKKETQNTKQKDFEVVPIEDNSKYIFLSKCATMFYPVKGNWDSGIREIFACGIQNWRKFSYGIRNPGLWNPEDSSRNPQFH